MHKSVVILGAGGHGRVIADIILSAGDQVYGFLDDSDKLDRTIGGFPILGNLEDVSKYREAHTFVIGIGANKIRKQLSELLDIDWYTAIHPSAVIARDVTVGAGSVVMAGAIISTGTRIGNHCIINTGAVIDHDNLLADFVHISPGATLCGTVHIGERTHVGAGAVLKNNITITYDCIIGAGALVVKDIKEPGIYVGVPIKKLNNNFESKLVSE